MSNLFEPNSNDPSREQFDTLLQTSTIHIEKITSYGQTSQAWYEQERDEWVVVVEGQGELLFEDGSVKVLAQGDYLHIPKMQKHKVIHTASPTIWLAIHFN